MSRIRKAAKMIDKSTVKPGDTLSWRGQLYRVYGLVEYLEDGVVHVVLRGHHGQHQRVSIAWDRIESCSPGSDEFYRHG